MWPTTRHFAALAIPLFIATVASADDWPQWRGPNRDGVWAETGTLASFPTSGLKVRWRAPIGFGWSSPVVANGRVFVTDSQLLRPAAKERVLCFDEPTGKPLWTHAYAVTYPNWAFDPGQEGRPSATPIAENDKVYALGGNGHVHCLNASSGKPHWEKRLDKEYQVRELICRASPLIEGNLLIVFTGGKPGASVVALERNSGKEVWKALDEAVTNSSPIVIVAGGKRQLIVWAEAAVYSLDPVTGKTYWRERFQSNNNDAVATPVYLQNRLLISGLMLGLAADQPAAIVLWPNTKALSRTILSNTSTAMLQGDYVYSARKTGELVCLEARTGKLVWETAKVTDLKGGASIHLTANGDSALLYTERGELIRARLSPKGYEEIGRARLLEPTYPFAGRKCAWAPPAFANRHVFARSDKELVCVSLEAP